MSYTDCVMCRVENISVVRLKGLHWAGQTLRMDSKRLPRRMLHNTVGGKRPVGITETRCFQAVGKDYKKILGIINW